MVAVEVCALAQRSAAAGHEIKTLIGQSDSNVLTGSQMVAGAGRRLEELVRDVLKVKEVVGDTAWLAMSRVETLRK